MGEVGEQRGLLLLRRRAPTSSHDLEEFTIEPLRNHLYEGIALLVTPGYCPSEQTKCNESILPSAELPLARPCPFIPISERIEVANRPLVSIRSPRPSEVAKKMQMNHKQGENEHLYTPLCCKETCRHRDHHTGQQVVASDMMVVKVEIAIDANECVVAIEQIAQAVCIRNDTGERHNASFPAPQANGVCEQPAG